MHKLALAPVFLACLCTIAPTRADEPARETAYALRGVFRGLDPATGQATVTHEEVRGYMPAMTMNFDLATTEEVRGLRPGDTFTCQLRVTDAHARLAGIHKEDVAPVAPFGTALPAGRATELGVGDPLPDIELTNQRGETIRLHDFGGEPLAISFIYLRCALPTYCPLLNRNFQSAQGLLERLGMHDRARFLSVSMDPEHDSPKALAAYASALDADSSGWIFAVADGNALHRLGDAVGLEFRREGGVINHNLRTVVVDGQGRIRRIFRGNIWTPQELVSELRAAANPCSTNVTQHRLDQTTNPLIFSPSPTSFYQHP